MALAMPKGSGMDVAMRHVEESYSMYLMHCDYIWHWEGQCYAGQYYDITNYWLLLSLLLHK